MNCDHCPVEQQCFYPFKPCDCLDQRKFWDKKRRDEYDHITSSNMGIESIGSSVLGEEEPTIPLSQVREMMFEVARAFVSYAYTEKSLKSEFDEWFNYKYPQYVEAKS